MLDSQPVGRNFFQKVGKSSHHLTFENGKNLEVHPVFEKLSGSRSPPESVEPLKVHEPLPSVCP
jgi:hypothetical protein